ncbi:hypothetical protein [Micromonospora sagamiensis]|uniref:Uncharacterized protein n=1 Tax=Micromonospora sagamiensis TaxID=47875 RepID=A0A562WFY9_9ACTN|nr:hypothetical protein [Micromonospora sagamiensis]TWJ29146.1 hypothetical protein JD81_02652 [Micromonospora sagamiensis]BCL17829.1 hypothetical protein GCM10017556_55680 [Micromonospora sagamiensis]
MADDHSAESFSDADFAFLRYARFGELPSPVRPDDRVELTETGQLRDGPTVNPDEWQLRLGPGIA